VGWMINQFPTGCLFVLFEELENQLCVLLLPGSLIYQQPLDILASRRFLSKMPGRSTDKKSVDDYRARGEDQLFCPFDPGLSLSSVMTHQIYGADTTKSEECGLGVRMTVTI
jgi:hypothetical protein